MRCVYKSMRRREQADVSCFPSQGHVLFTTDGDRQIRRMNYRTPNSASSIAFSSPRALFIVSCHSLAGTLSATMPAPACT